MSSTAQPDRAHNAPETYPATVRIRTRRDFLRVQSEGRRVHTPSFVIMVLPGSKQRMGITITRRHANSVGRNRVKRVVREVFRRNRALFPERCEFVMVARSGADRLGYEAVRSEIVAARAAMLRAANHGGGAGVLPEPKP
jgi:ribonuclease P protein component